MLVAKVTNFSSALHQTNRRQSEVVASAVIVVLLERDNQKWHKQKHKQKQQLTRRHKVESDRRINMWPLQLKPSQHLKSDQSWPQLEKHKN